MFVVKVLKKIFADKDVKRSHLAQLSKACETALGIMLINLGIESFVANFDWILIVRFRGNTKTEAWRKE